jgi:hypothetical protein
MSKNAMRFKSPLKSLFYSLSTLLFGTGIIWIGLHYTAYEGPLLSLTMKWHGAAAIGASVLLGWLMPVHILPGLERGRNRGTGLVILALIVGLMISGYGLYYFGGESLRQITRITHQSLGCVIPFLLVWHIRRGKRDFKKSN